MLLSQLLQISSAEDKIHCLDSTGTHLCVETAEQLRQKPIQFLRVLRYEEANNGWQDGFKVWLSIESKPKIDDAQNDEFSLCEVVADIAWEAALMTRAGEICCEDSRNMVQSIYKWAKNYEAIWKAADPDGQNPDYLEDIEAYAREKLLAEYKNSEYEAKLTYSEIVSALPKDPAEGCHFWTDGEYILCRTIDDANTLADFMEATGVSDTCTTGTFEPQSDKLDGWSYVDC